MNRILTQLAMLCMAGLLSACAGGMKTLPDGTVLAQATVGDTLDRSASYTARYSVVGQNPNGSPIYQEIAGDLTVGPTVGGQVLAAAIPGVAVAATNGIAGAAIARQNSCRSEQAGCNNTTIMVDGAEALASNVAQSASEVTVTETTTSGCATCGILND